MKLPSIFYVQSRILLKSWTMTRKYHVTYLVLPIHWLGEARGKRIRMRLAPCERDIFACCDWPIRATLQSETHVRAFGTGTIV